MTSNNATGGELTIFPERRGYRLHLVRVNPRHERLIDPFTHDPIFESLHNIECCIGDDQVTPLAEVRDHLVPFTDDKYDDEMRGLLADCDIYNVLSHPRSPYGLGWQPKKRTPGDMLVVYRQGNYTRDPDGVLHKLGGRADIWPAPDQWRVNNIRLRVWARREGLLP